jgi:hypothetical protein
MFLSVILNVIFYATREQQSSSSIEAAVFEMEIDASTVRQP